MGKFCQYSNSYYLLFELKNLLKSKLIKTCQSLLEEKEIELKSSEESARQSAASETKSSAGDKHETARELIHQEREIITQRLTELYKQMSELNLAGSNNESDVIKLGSLVKTSLGYFFLGPSLGFVKVNDLKIACVSTSSPIGEVLLGKTTGSVTEFRNNPIKIESIE